jgi:MFS family permease
LRQKTVILAKKVRQYMAHVSLWHHKQKTLASGQINQDAPRFIKESLWTRDFVKIWVLNLTLCGWSFMINAAFPLYIEQLGGTKLLIGITAAGFAITSLVMRPLAGWMMDNHSRSWLLIWGSVSLIAISLLFLVAPLLGIAVALRLISGFLLSGVSTASNTNACDAIPQSRFGEGMGFLGLGNTLATALGPALGLAIVAIAGWGFAILFIVSIVLMILAVFIARGLSYKTVKRRIYLLGRRKRGLAALFNADALPASVVTLFASAPYGGVSVFIALYGAFSGLGKGGLFFVLVALGTGSTRLFSGRLADKKGEQPMVVLGNISFLLALLTLLWESSTCYYLSGLLFGLGFGFSTPAMQTMAVRVVPLEKRGSASSTFLCAYDIGSGLGGLTAGWLVTMWGYRPMFAALSVYIVFSSLIYVLWAAKTPSAFKVYQRR